MIPTILRIDVEPDRVVCVERARWSGFELAPRWIEPLRENLSRRTGAPVHFCWHVRVDPLIASCYGSATWGLEAYDGILDRFRRQGDEIGLHVHPFRWSTGLGEWIQDFENQAWIEECLTSAVCAFRRIYGEGPQSTSLGNHWMSSATVALLRRLGVTADLTVRSGAPSGKMPSPGGRSIGVIPDCRQAPLEIYRPSASSFLEPDPEPGTGPWFIPVSTYAPSSRGAGWACARQMYLRRYGVQPDGGILLRLGPRFLARSVDDLLERQSSPHLLFPIRSALLANPVRQPFLRSLNCLTGAPLGSKLRFHTPAETLRRHLTSIG